MKHLLIIFLLIPRLGFSDEPERIVARTKVLYPASWYIDQADRWKLKLEDNSTSPDAWLNFYAASRYAQASPEVLDAIVADMTRKIPGSFEALIASGWNMGYQSGARALLEKAYQMDPDNPGTYALLTLLAEFDLNKSQRIAFSKKLHQSGQISASLLNYSYNVLMSVEQGAILFTEGESTTIPLYVLQDVFDVRKDIVVLNLDLLVQSEYMNEKFIESGLSPAILSNTMDEKKAICMSLPAENKSRKFYYALTLQKDNIESIKDQLYVVGLASELSADRMDNISLIRENLEKKFMMDYLRVDFNGETVHSTGRVLSANYLLPILLLYEQYQTEGNVSRMTELEVIMRKIATDSGKEQLVSNFLQKGTSPKIPYIVSDFELKSAGNFKPVTKKLQANESEVTNAQYNAFLKYLMKNNMGDLYDKYKFDLSAYQEPALAFMKNYSADRMLTKKDKFFSNYPAVNIPFEGALAYCEWLTTQYNNSSEKKFKKVRFRLPSKNEWIIAAAAVANTTSFDPEDIMVDVKFYPNMSYDAWGKQVEGKRVKLSDEDIQYPWFRIYNLRNSPVNNKGCYLGNFKMAADAATCKPNENRISTPDGFMAMAFVQAYFPNDIGLYDVVGNVAEMIDERGRAMGGSWNHLPQQSTIKSVNDYEGPDAAVGFRVFMEIIEE